MAQNLAQIQEAHDNAVELFENGNGFELLKEVFEQLLAHGEVATHPRIIGERLIAMAERQLERKREEGREVDAMDAMRAALDRRAL